MKFDPRAAKLLKPGELLTIDGCPGLRLVASDTRRTWTYRYRSKVDGKVKQVALGQWPAMPIAAAAGAWQAARDARDAGRDLADERRIARATTSKPAMISRGSPTVREVASAYLAGHVEKSRKAKGATEVARMFEKMLGNVADLDAPTLTRSQAFELIESHAGIPVQAAKLKAELGAAWDYALDAGRLPESTPNWWRQILRGKLKSTGKKIAGEKIGTSKRVLSASELGALIDWLPNFSRLVEDALTLYLWTGTRGAEIMAMTGAEVNEEGGCLWWTIPKAKTKNARHANATDLRVPLVGRAERVVRRRMAQCNAGYLFPSESGPGHTQQKVISESVFFRQPYCEIRPKWARARLTVTRWSPHDLRRTTRTTLARIGCPSEIAEAILGHMQPGIVGTYNLHAYDAERLEWLTKLDAELERLAAGHFRSLGAGQH
ncbi:tyrosine-type recombinase/integrase [Paraburkholderia sp. EG287A]|uniref:tyrosine-type recombinase/integrase n=1 Tax=Paraburkholderia sp. EG287A TaxID=3237012 RepID=UPI0034D283D0